MLTPREKRLLIEFEAMKALRSPHVLFDFACAKLTAKEAAEHLRATMSSSIIIAGLPDFLTPEDFEAEFPGRAPDKYLITYNCKGLIQQRDGSIGDSYFHQMEVVFTYRFPSEPPRFIWLTPNIWHPNFDGPYVCLQGRSFAVGLTLDHVVPEVGRMVQYQNFNVSNPLRQEVADWANRHSQRFPVDDRDILDRRKTVSKVKCRSSEEQLPRDETGEEEPGLLVELID